MSVKYICILDETIYEIPVSKIKNGRFPKPELAGQTVIMMEMIYQIKDRRPFKIVRIIFNRVSFDENGIYDIHADSVSKEFGVKLEYIFQLDQYSEPLPIPIAPILPTKKEIATIKLYLNRKYTALLENSPNAIEYSIALLKDRHEKEIKMMKESHKR